MQLQTRISIDAPTDLLAIAVLPADLDFPGSGDGLLSVLDRALEGQIRQAITDERYKAKPGQRLGLPTGRRLASRRILLVGLGDLAPATLGPATRDAAAEGLALDPVHDEASA